MEQHNTFFTDLQTGHIAEDLAQQIFIAKGYNVTGMTRSEIFSDYDLLVQSANCNTCKVYQVEVKDDVLSNTTGNAAIEQFKWDNRGNKIDSGLSATKAHVWVIKLKNQFYSIPVIKLKELLKTHYGYYGQVTTKDNKELALLSIDFLKNYCKIFK